MKSLDDLNALTDGITETVKPEIKKQEGRYISELLAPLAASVVQPLISSVVKGINRRDVRRGGRGYVNKNFWFCSILYAIL